MSYEHINSIGYKFINMPYLFFLLCCTIYIPLFGQESIKMEIGEEKTVPKMGYNAPLTHSPNWDNNSFITAVKSLNPHILRYPGGANSFYWDWKKGKTKNYQELSNAIVGINKKYTIDYLQNSTNKGAFWRQIKRYNASKQNGNTIESFAWALKQTKSSAIFVLNVVTSSLDEQIEMLQHAKNNSIDIEFIEIGNEINHKHELLEQVYPNATAYTDTCYRWIKAIRQLFPSVKIGVVGGNKGKFKHWNETVRKGIASIPNLHFVLHYYPIFEDPINFNIQSEYRAFLIRSASDLNQKLKNWGWKETEDYSTWVTEYNIIEKGPRTIHNKWAHGLFTAMQIHHLIQKTDAEIFAFHAIGATKFTPFSSLDLMSTDVKKNKKTAAGISTYLWNKLTKFADKMYSVKLNNSNWSHNNRSFNPIYAYVSYSGKKRKLLVCNASEKARKITLTDLGITGGLMEQYSGRLTHDVRGSLNQGAHWSVTQNEVSKFIELPSYSITLIEE